MKKIMASYNPINSACSVHQHLCLNTAPKLALSTHDNGPLGQLSEIWGMILGASIISSIFLQSRAMERRKGTSDLIDIIQTTRDT